MYTERMRFFSVSIITALLLPSSVFAADAVSRRDGFLIIWNSIGRPVEATRETPYVDVPKTDPDFLKITYAKARGILNPDNTYFRPNEPLSVSDALLLLFRTRSVERLKADGDIDFMKLPDASDVAPLMAKYAIDENLEMPTISSERLLSLMRVLDKALMDEQHEVSLYSEKFHGKGTAFGESFDMHALTAAHRSFPANTLLRVTNIGNGKSVTVRINDRGPFVQGRDLDLSLAAFTTIAKRSVGKIQATFERLGDAFLTTRCRDDRYQKRITRDVRFDTGVPHFFPLGKTLELSSTESFVIRDLMYPDGVSVGTQTWVTSGEAYAFTPSTIGTYRFLMGTRTGRIREMTMEVVDCGA